MIEYDREVFDKEFAVGTFQVENETIIKFAQAVGETDPVYLDEEAAKQTRFGGLIAPPTFYSVFRLQAAPDLKVKFGRTSFNAGQRCEFLAPIRPGDTITATTKWSDVYEKTGRSGNLAFAVRETTFTNQHGEKVTAVYESTVYRE